MFKKLSELVARLRGQRADNAAAYDMLPHQLQQLSVPYAQGFLFSAPLDAEAVAAFLGGA